MGIFRYSAYGALGAVLGMLVAFRTIDLGPLGQEGPMDGVICLVIGILGGLPVGMMVGVLVHVRRLKTFSEVGVFGCSVIGAGLGVLFSCGTSFLGLPDQSGPWDEMIYLTLGSSGGAIAGMLVGAVVLVYRQKTSAAVEAEKFRLTTAANWRVNTVLAGDALCPRGGNWTASLASSHADSQAFERCQRTFRVEYGSSFPDPEFIMAGIDARDVRWQWAPPMRASSA